MRSASASARSCVWSVGELRVRDAVAAVYPRRSRLSKRVAAIEHWLAQGTRNYPGSWRTLGTRARTAALGRSTAEHSGPATTSPLRHPAAEFRPRRSGRMAQTVPGSKALPSPAPDPRHGDVWLAHFHNRREIGSSAGTCSPTPYDSGEIHREQGISKAGNKRVRRRDYRAGLAMVETPPTAR